MDSALGDWSDLCHGVLDLREETTKAAVARLTEEYKAVSPYIGVQVYQHPFKSI